MSMKQEYHLSYEDQDGEVNPPKGDGWCPSMMSAASPQHHDQGETDTHGGVWILWHRTSQDETGYVCGLCGSTDMMVHDAKAHDVGQDQEPMCGMCGEIYNPALDGDHHDCPNR